MNLSKCECFVTEVSCSLKLYVLMLGISHVACILQFTVCSFDNGHGMEVISVWAICQITIFLRSFNDWRILREHYLEQIIWRDIYIYIYISIWFCAYIKRLKRDVFALNTQWHCFLVDLSSLFSWWELELGNWVDVDMLFTSLY